MPTVGVLNDRYPTAYNTPRNSRYHILRCAFVPFNLISRKIEGITIILSKRVDLYHCHNRIPILTFTPFIMGFESHLPRFFGGEKSRLFKFMLGRLSSKKCRRIIAMSHFAKNVFLDQHGDYKFLDNLKNKLMVRYPNIILPEFRTNIADSSVTTLTFVGGHFGRKGGAVTARAAEISRERNLPLQFNIVSSLQVGVWSDPATEGFFEPYFRMLTANNVTHHLALSHSEVLALLRDSDLSILTTFSDTFGFTVIESLAVGTPAIVTPQGALPEFIDETNGFFVPLEVNAHGEWVHVGRSDKATAEFAELVTSEIERMAQDVVGIAMRYRDMGDKRQAMRVAARGTAEKHFDSAAASLELDDMYEKAMQSA